MKEIDFSNARRNFKREDKKREYLMKREKDSASLARITYSNPATIKAEVEKMGYKFIKYLEYKDTECYIAEHREGQVLSFRGSTSLKDWIENADFELKDTFIGMCHTGYFDTLMEMYGEILKYIGDDRILLPSHSKGAGDSIIFGKMLKVCEGYKPKPFAFEPPRITDDENFMPETEYTINSGDMIPRLPFGFMGYHLTGNMHYFTTTGRYNYEPRLIKRIMDFAADSIGDTLLSRAKELEQDHSIYNVEKLWLKNWDKIKIKL